MERTDDPGCLVQALWFLFVGWWLGALAVSAAWILNVTIIGLPLGIAILNNIPKLIALQGASRFVAADVVEGKLVVVETDLPQRPFWQRTVFFLLVGWWWSGIWMSLAYLCCVTLILMPIGLPMFRMTPAMTTLCRY